MRDLEVYASAEAIHRQVGSLWKTELFRSAHRGGGWIREVVDAMCARPVLFCEMSDVSVERTHFYAWMGVVPKRHNYENPAISDLYYLHEYLHLGQLRYPKGEDTPTWSQRIWDNERHASLGSEVYVYFHLPALRAQTFAFEIWADRFLADGAWRRMFADDRPGFERAFEQRREQAMHRPIAGDENERLIHSYFGLNVAWAEVWAGRREEVEEAMRAFVAQPDRKLAAQRHLKWLETQAAGCLCPFEAEARAFAAVVSGA